MVQACLDCKSNSEYSEKELDKKKGNYSEEDLHDRIPIWYKKAGNYSRLPKFLNCSDGYNAFEGELKEGPPELNDNYVELPIEIKQKNTLVLYWAANSSKNHHKINDAKTAYGNEENRGLLRSDDKGKLTLKFNCHQP